MARTIGNDKGSTTRARPSADTENDRMDAPQNDEPRDEELAGGADEEADASENALALSASGAVAQRPQVAVGRRAHQAPQWMMHYWGLKFIAESYNELRKVTAPTLPEAWNMTLVVIAMSAVLAAILGLADIALLKALTWIVGLGNP